MLVGIILPIFALLLIFAVVSGAFKKILVNAATIPSSVPAAMQLHYLQTLSEVGGENNSTIIFPMPIDIVKPFLQILDKNAAPAAGAPGVATNGLNRR